MVRHSHKGGLIPLVAVLWLFFLVGRDDISDAKHLQVRPRGLAIIEGVESRMMLYHRRPLEFQKLCDC